MTAYLDRLSFFSIWWIVAAGHGKGSIFYIDSTPLGERFGRWLNKLGFFPHCPERIRFSLADICLADGQCQNFTVYENAREIGLRISDSKLKTSIFLKGFRHKFEERTLVRFFEKIIEEQVLPVVFLIQAGASWQHQSRSNQEKQNQPLLLHRKTGYYEFFKEYADARNISYREYRDLTLPCLPYLRQAGQMFMTRMKGRLFSKKILPNNESIPPPDDKRDIAPDSHPPGKFILSTCYTGRTITLDRCHRSEIFWLLDSDFLGRTPFQLIFSRGDITVTKDEIELLRRREIFPVSLGKYNSLPDTVRAWRPGSLYRKNRMKLFSLLAFVLLRTCFRLQFPPGFMVLHMLNFLNSYAFWFDFFSAHNIRINVSPNDFGRAYAAVNTALCHCGGVSVSYQWSNMETSLLGMSNCSDVFFTFGPEYHWIWKTNHSQIGQMINCGYITDHSFSPARSHAMKLREKLRQNNAGFIIAFFDENSSDDRMSIITHEKSCQIYEFLIRWMLADDSLGLIFKPGYPRTLFQRLESIRELFDTALQSGRCCMLDEGSHVTRQYPTEAAQAADVCIGLQLSGTAALEAYLSGTPTVFIDLEKLYFRSIYQWGKGRVIFDNMEELRHAVEQYRQDPASLPGFGDLARWAQNKDPFQDGRAARRMSSYIDTLIKAFMEGKSRDEAIASANALYGKTWGQEHIVSWH